MDEIEPIVQMKLAALGDANDARRWRVVLSILTRMFTSVGMAWERWGPCRVVAADSLRTLFLLASDARLTQTEKDSVRSSLAEFNISDDGSPEWENLLNIASLCTSCLEGTPIEELVGTACRLFLEGEFNRLANELAEREGRPVSLAKAEPVVLESAAWLVRQPHLV